MALGAKAMYFARCNLGRGQVGGHEHKHLRLKQIITLLLHGIYLIYPVMKTIQGRELHFIVIAALMIFLLVLIRHSCIKAGPSFRGGLGCAQMDRCTARCVVAACSYRVVSHSVNYRFILYLQDKTHFILNT